MSDILTDMTFCNRALHTVLAALRLYQSDEWVGDELLGIASNMGQMEPLDFDEINRLCEALNEHLAAVAPIVERGSNDARYLAIPTYPDMRESIERAHTASVQVRFRLEFEDEATCDAVADLLGTYDGYAQAGNLLQVDTYPAPLKVAGGSDGPAD